LGIGRGTVAEEKAEMIAVCGIDCSNCDIRRAKSDPETMDDVIRWFREKLNKELVPEQVCCDWCLGDRAKHWDAECRILRCAVDEHGVDSCSDCSEFPCDYLNTWAKINTKYARAFARLKTMKESKKSRL
jgi:hypothetical protein